MIKQKQNSIEEDPILGNCFIQLKSKEIFEYYEIVKFVEYVGEEFRYQVIDKKTKQKKMLQKIKKNEDIDYEELVHLLKQMLTINNPSIINYTEYYEDQINYYLLSDWKDGITIQNSIYLHDFMSDKIIADYMTQILRILEILHLHQIYKVKFRFGDFIVNSKLQIMLRCLDIVQTQQKNITYSFQEVFLLAPEVLVNPPQYNESTLMYSAGIILYFLLRGRSPFKSNCIEDLIQEKVKEKIGFEGWENIHSLGRSLLYQMIKESRINFSDIYHHPFLINLNNDETHQFSCLKSFNVHQSFMEETQQYIQYLQYCHQLIKNKIKQYDISEISTEIFQEYQNQMTFHWFRSSLNEIQDYLEQKGYVPNLCKQQMLLLEIEKLFLNDEYNFATNYYIDSIEKLGYNSKEISIKFLNTILYFFFKDKIQILQNLTDKISIIQFKEMFIYSIE